LLKDVIDSSAAAMKTKLNNREEAIIEDGMKRGAAAALMFCESFLPNEANRGVVDSPPSCPPSVKGILARMAGHYGTRSKKLERWKSTTSAN